MLSLTYLLPVAIISYIYPSSPATTVDLHDALSKGLVKVEPISTGTYGENSLTLKVTNKTRGPLTITVPGGTIYEPEDPGDQTLIQLEPENLIVSAGGTNQLSIDAYCSESSDGVPNGGSSFAVKRTSNAKLLGLVAHLKTRKGDRDGYQDAVWAITDAQELSYMPNETEEDKELRNYVAQSTGLANNWYGLTPERRVDADRRIITETTRINGTLSFACTPGKTIIEEVRKKDGSVIISNNTNFAPRGDKLSYEFKLSLKGWEKGEYYVLLKNNVKDLARYDFTL